MELASPLVNPWHCTLCCPSDVQVAPLKGARAATMELLLLLSLSLSLLSLLSLLCLGRLLGLFRCVCVRVFWDEALKAVSCELIVAEHARLTDFGWLA